VKQENVTVRIPAGVADGGRIRVPGKGGEGANGAPAGDLYATIRLRPDPVFRLEGRDLHVEVPVTVAEATLGAKIEVPTLDGRATLTIPPGTDSGRKLRLRGKGMPNPAGGDAGDLYVTLQIRVPRDLDDDARAKLEALGRFDPADLRKDLFR
jgi:DnaJ-class molecular chaperone